MCLKDHCQSLIILHNKVNYSIKHFNNEFTDKPQCKFGEECFAYKRVVNDGCNELKDRTHIVLYRHPPRSRKIKSSEEINSFHLNDIWIDNTPLYRPNEDEQKDYNNIDGYLSLLINEVINNGHKNDLCLSDEDGKK